MKCAQHAAHNPQFEKMVLFRHPWWRPVTDKGPTHMVKGGLQEIDLQPWVPRQWTSTTNW